MGLGESSPLEWKSSGDILESKKALSFHTIDLLGDQFCVNYRVRDVRDEIQTLDCANVVNRKRCAVYLYHMFPHRDFSIDQVERCFSIMRLVTRKMTAAYPLGGSQVHIQHRHECFSLPQSLESMVFGIFQRQHILIQLSSDEDDLCSLKEVIEEDEKYQRFCDEWNNFISFDCLFRALQSSLPTELVHKVASFF